MTTATAGLVAVCLLWAGMVHWLFIGSEAVKVMLLAGVGVTVLLDA